MIGSWRWFGPRDRLGLDEIAQTGASPGNDVPAIARRFAEQIDFARLRNLSALRTEERRRLDQGAAEAESPFRPDHRHAIGPDLSRDTHRGYPLVGRLRGLAELRGVLKALDHPKVSHA